ncbi:PaaI family thioesterase [Rhodovibrio salinarum]|uniref:PaaI family thioesterase n=1 Tax=Rhodovibrio salinarum TaxID=1087 RepID=A0A934QJH4_9PROT|nr:PaaI family thioesterase [Rhodovibrio salinarum]MBK1698056.1 PaaI family thioesterase [Rhodovibrio salinarum]
MTDSNDPLTPAQGFAALVGYRIADWSWQQAAVELGVVADHLNRSGILHGGVLTTLIDTACGYSGCFCDSPGRARRAMTLQLNTQFLAPAQAGQRLVARARQTGGGKSVFFADCTVHADDGTLIGRGDGVFKYTPGSGDPAGVAVDQLPGT